MAEVRIHHGDCTELLWGLEEQQFDSCVTDPPYHLVSVVKRFGGANAAPAKFGTDGVYARASAGFMGKAWDGAGEDGVGVAQRPETWAAVGRVMKPGAFLLAFSGTRTYHRMVCAIEDAGFVIRDQIGWLYGNGFPKSHNLSKAFDRRAGAERVVIEPYGQGFRAAGSGLEGWQRPGHAVDKGRSAPSTDEAKRWDGWGTALKPAWEPIVVAQWPMSERTIAENVLKWGVGAFNIEASRVPAEKATGWGAKGGEVGPARRWPANVAHDGSEEIVSGLGGPARYYYCAKASKAERCGSKHPTVKPLALMEWLVGLVTPPGGLVLDPFLGSGTTAVAAVRRGFNCVGYDLDEASCADARNRIKILAFNQRSDAHRVKDAVHNT